MGDAADAERMHNPIAMVPGVACSEVVALAQRHPELNVVVFGLVRLNETSQFQPEGTFERLRTGEEIGSNVIYRYIDGELADGPLGNPVTGEFPHGALVEGINDIAGDSVFDVHVRLNVNTNGCRLPYAR